MNKYFEFLLVFADLTVDLSLPSNGMLWMLNALNHLGIEMKFNGRRMSAPHPALITEPFRRTKSIIHMLLLLLVVKVPNADL